MGGGGPMFTLTVTSPRADEATRAPPTTMATTRVRVLRSLLDPDAADSESPPSAPGHRGCGTLRLPVCKQWLCQTDRPTEFPTVPTQAPVPRQRGSQDGERAHVMGISPHVGKR